MAWQKKSTSTEISVDTKVDVDLNEFRTAQLLQALIEGDIISENEAEQILQRAGEGLVDPFEMDARYLIDTIELETARAELFAGRRTEALIHLERALGGDFVGRLACA